MSRQFYFVKVKGTPLKAGAGAKFDLKRKVIGRGQVIGTVAETAGKDALCVLVELPPRNEGEFVIDPMVLRKSGKPVVIGGKPCHVVSISKRQTAADAWVEEATQPFEIDEAELKQLVPDDTKGKGKATEPPTE